jgi:hypothetical protein
LTNSPLYVIINTGRRKISPINKIKNKMLVLGMMTNEIKEYKILTNVKTVERAKKIIVRPREVSMM